MQGTSSAALAAAALETLHGALGPIGKRLELRDVSATSLTLVLPVQPVHTKGKRPDPSLVFLLSDVAGYLLVHARYGSRGSVVLASADIDLLGGSSQGPLEAHMQMLFAGPRRAIVSGHLDTAGESAAAASLRFAVPRARGRGGLVCPTDGFEG